jgi:hypothetical protein
MTFSPVGGELLHADGRTDMTKLKVAVLIFVNVPESNIFPSFSVA